MSAAVWFGGAASACAVSCAGLASGLVAVVLAGFSSLLTSIDAFEFGRGTAGAVVASSALRAAVCVACGGCWGVVGVPVLASAWAGALGGVWVASPGGGCRDGAAGIWSAGGPSGTGAVWVGVAVSRGLVEGVCHGSVSQS